ncbi:MAG TPA: DUF2752 domain-containing protein [bacterium]|nr:DUF2752 domain-containing protein [bacterium]
MKHRVLISLIAIACGIPVFLKDPAECGLFMPCPFHWATGFYCPGCGSLRALHRLFHGDLTGALAMNPLMILSIPFLAAFIIRPEWTRKPWVPYLVLGIIVAYWVARNIPVYPLMWLAPH